MFVVQYVFTYECSTEDPPNFSHDQQNYYYYFL